MNYTMKLNGIKVNKWELNFQSEHCESQLDFISNAHPAWVSVTNKIYWFFPKLKKYAKKSLPSDELECWCFVYTEMMVQN